MKKKYLILAVLALTLLLGTGSVLACGWGGFFGLNNANPDEIATRQQTMFERQAQILGISVEEVKNYWAEGKTIKEIMEEKGISQEQIQERMKELRLQEMKSFLQILVDKGVITQEQANRRLEFMENWQNQIGKGGMGKMGRRFGRFGFPGFGW